jgi:hypothetical protein
VETLLQEESAVREYLKSFMPGYAEKAWKGGELMQQMLQQRGRPV